MGICIVEFVMKSMVTIMITQPPMKKIGAKAAKMMMMIEVIKSVLHATKILLLTR